MLQVDNRTPFVPGMFVFPDPQGVDTLYVVLKATFSFASGRVTLAETRRAIATSDTFLGEPGASSLAHANEAHLLKTTTDVAVVGEAVTPDGRPAASCAVRVSVGPVQRLLQVTGDRVWQTRIGGQRPTSPEPFVRMPLSYERAYGGVHDQGPKGVLFEARNPLGKGYRGKRSAADVEGMPLPNIEDPAALIHSPDDSPAPAGVGFIAPSWEPRKSFAGTYDERWRTTRAPYLPADFDPRFFQAANPALVCPAPLHGGEPVELANLSIDGVVRFRLPACAFDVAVTVGGRIESPPMTLETVLFEPTDALFSLTFRGAVPCDKRALQIEAVRFDLRSLKGLEGGA
ncbi:MAG: DUF2169 domain-containing protein [Byssovorax sp.]